MEKKPFRPTPPRPRPQQNRNIKNDNDPQYPINEEITVPEVRVVPVNDEQSIVPGIYPIAKALSMAESMELDLILINSNANPPVCKIFDYQKFVFQEKKRQKENKAKQAKVVIKEIRFGPQTDEHDYEFKLKHAIEFLKEGAKVKSYVFFKGRSILFKEQGETLLRRFAEDLEEYGKLEQQPKLEGKRMIVMFAPKKNK